MEVDEQAKRRPQRPELPSGQSERTAGRPNCQKRHGYAAVEICERAARIIRWEIEEAREETPELAEDQRRLFRLGEWLSKQPISDQARAEYFDIERVSPIWTGVNEFNTMVDALERGPDWSEQVVSVTTPEGSESFVVHKRNPVDIVRHLIGLVRLRTQMHYGPERHTTITVNGQRVRVYSEMWTGDWWWRMQVRTQVERQQSCLAGIRQHWKYSEGSAASPERAGNDVNWPHPGYKACVYGINS